MKTPVVIFKLEFKWIYIKMQTIPQHVLLVLQLMFFKNHQHFFYDGIIPFIHLSFRSDLLC